MFVIATARGGYLSIAGELPPGVIVVDAPALGIKDHVKAHKMEREKERLTKLGS